jgi:anti-sigma B factor antagonist
VPWQTIIQPEWSETMPTSQISLDVRKPAAQVAVIDVHGQVTGAAEVPLMNAYDQVSKNGIRTLILNFSDLEYMNSSGIGLLVTLLIRVNRQKQRMFSYGLSDHYQQIFQLTRLNEAITIYPDEASALTAAAH